MASPTAASGAAALPLTAQALTRAEDQIFRRWQRRRPDLLRDGALGGPASTYLAQPIRVLFVLKEPNDSGGRWSKQGADLRLHASAFAGLRSTFPVLLLLAHLAQQAATDPALSLSFAAARRHLLDPAFRLSLLQSLVLLNLRKSPGGPVCKDRILAAAVIADGDLLCQQLGLYRPHLTVAGGSAVFDLLAQLTRQTVASTDQSRTRPWFTSSHLGLCLSFFHPQATKGYEFLYNLLRDNLLAHGFHPSPPFDRPSPGKPSRLRMKRRR